MFQEEIILDKNNLKFSLYPIQYHNLWDEYKKQQASFWRAEEVDCSQDFQYFEKLDENVKHVIKMILSFFASSDGIVNLNISSRLMNEITINEAIYCYQYQMMMENIHSEMYSILLDNLIRDREEKYILFNSIKLIPSIKRISDWALNWINSDVSIGHRIIAFLCVEGIFFSGAFACIYWLKQYYKGSNMVGLIKSNEFISRDEKMHADFACELYKMIINKLSFDEIKNIFIEAVELSKIFNNETFKIKLLGINEDLMNQYIEYIADYWIVSLGYKKIYNSNNPFTFMNSIGMMQRTNFHEGRATEYQLASNFVNPSELDINEDF